MHTSDLTWRGGFENLSREHAFEPLRIEGEIPRDLEGTFYRNGPGRFDVAGERYRHWFDGDGAITAVRIVNGSASGAARLVRTPWLIREERARKRLFGSYDTPMRRPISELFFGDTKNPANTSVLLWQDRLFALCEGGKPFEISTSDLATLGERSFEGVITKAFSAHAHYVPDRKCTYNFGLAIQNNTRVEAYALPDEGRARRLAAFDLPGARMNHDFAVTPKHLVWFIAPFFMSPLNLILKRGMVSSARFDAARGTEIIVVPIDDPESVVRFTVPTFYMEHVVNAFERANGETVIDYVHYEDIRRLEDYVGGLAGGAPKRTLASTLRRAVIDVAKRTFRSEPLLDEAVELPRVAPSVDGRAHRFAYAVSAPELAPPKKILKHDLERNRVEHYDPGADFYPSEAVFVPREDAKTEDDGYLLTLVYDARARTSRLEILDARNPSAGPVARCAFDHAIPFGFHGAFKAKDRG